MCRAVRVTWNRHDARLRFAGERAVGSVGSVASAAALVFYPIHSVFGASSHCEEDRARNRDSQDNREASRLISTRNDIVDS
jgi:hypothetical protein